MTTERDLVIDENEALLAELLLDAGEAPSPGLEDKVVNRPSAAIPQPMTVVELSSAGWVYVWNKFTGDQSLCNRNMLPLQLDKREGDPASPHFGERVFTTRDPGIRPQEFSTLCMLHKDHPDRGFHDGLGLPVCPAGKLRNDYNMRLHMQHRHHAEWEALQEEARREREGQEREARLATIELARQGAEARSPAQPQETYSKKCPHCDEVFTAPSQRSIGGKIGGHIRKFHPKK